MSKSKDIITNSLEYHDKNREYYEKFYSKIKYIQFVESKSNLDYDKLVLYDKNKKKLLETRYEVIGQYINQSKTWAWAWSLNLSKNQFVTGRKILNYAFDLDTTDENQFLKMELKTSRFRISSPIQTDMHVSLYSYLSKIPVIFEHIYDNDHVEISEEGYAKIDPSHRKYKNHIIYYYFLLDGDKISK